MPATAKSARRRKPHPLDKGRDAAIALISQIADRAVGIYARHDVRADRITIVMDLTATHFHGQKLRLEELLSADDANFMHDIAGINRHLDRETCQFRDGFSPRFSLTGARR